MKKCFKCIALMLVLSLILASMPIMNVSAESTMTLAQLMAKFPKGYYWNHQINSYHNNSGIYGTCTNPNCNNPDGCTNHPCTSHDSVITSGYDCNNFTLGNRNGIQCMGFALKLASDAYGGYPYVNIADTTNISTAISIVKPGDVIRYTGGDAIGEHWVFVTAVSGSYITVGEANYGSHCQINWGRQINMYSFATIELYSAPYVLTTTSHTHSYTSAITKKPTCTTAGVRTFTCSCGASYTESISALGHAWNNGEVTVSAGCTTEGNKLYTCTRCSATKTEAFSATGHTPVTDEAVPATCEHTGLTEGSHCSVCSAIITSQETIPMVDHDDQLVGGTSCNGCVEAEYECANCHRTITKTVYGSVTSDWQETVPTGVDEDMIETKTQYRSSTYETTTANTSTLAGWEAIGDSTWKKSSTGTVDYIESFPSGFDQSNSYYTTYNKSVKNTETATKKRVYDTSNKTVVGYVYYHWCVSLYNEGAPSNKYISDVSGYDSASDRTFDAFHAFFSTTNYPLASVGGGVIQCSNASACNNVYWWFAGLPVYRCSYTDYVKQYSFERWTDYSQWQDEEITADDTTNVETRELYRISISPTQPYFLKILTNPTNRWYTKGAEFDPTGLTARLYYKDGTTKDIGVDDLTITGFDSSTDGVRKVTVSAEGVSNQLSYKIYGIAGVRGVSIVTKPSKLIYDQGEKISFDGAVFKVINEDGTKGDVIDNSEITMYGATTLTPGKLTVTFKYDSYYTTCTMKITDNKLISRYSYDSKPTKRVYSLGEEFDLDGFVANIVYFDGTTSAIDNDLIDVEGFDNTTTGVQSVTASYLGNEITTFNIKVA